MRSTHFDVAGTGFVALDRVYADDYEPFEALGGSCGNVLASLAMLGRKVAPLLVLGNDRVGGRLIAEFAGAGADTKFVHRRSGVASPVIAQRTNTSSGEHQFSFVCPETGRELPRYQPIGDAELRSAGPLLRRCAVFYTDRLSDTIVAAMEAASGAGATVFFEPSEIDDAVLVGRALSATSVLKYSFERIGDRLVSAPVRRGTIRIVTYGADGLEASQDDRRVWCNAVQADTVRDTSGSGDMVTVGVIDRILEQRGDAKIRWQLDAALRGLMAGQRLAAANCAFPGARGLFERLGARAARTALDGRPSDALPQLNPLDAAL